MNWSLCLQLESNESLCRLEMEGSGDALVPTRSTLTVDVKYCGLLQIQVTAHLPQTFTASKGRIVSAKPHLRVKISSSTEWSDSSEQSIRAAVETSAFSSIQSALDSSPVGSTLLIPAGSYFENLDVTKPVTLVGKSGSAGQAKLFGRLRLSSHNITLDGLAVFSMDATIPALEVTASSDILIHNCKILQDPLWKYNVHTRNTSAIYVANSLNVHLVNNFVSDYGIGLNLEKCSGCTVQSNLFQACWNNLRVAECENLRLIRNYVKENAAAVLSERNLETFCMKGSVLEEGLSRSGATIRGCSDHHCGDSASLYRTLKKGAGSDVTIITGTCSEQGSSDTANPRGCVRMQGWSVCRCCNNVPWNLIFRGQLSG